jgi:hypothetical protein
MVMVLDPGHITPPNGHDMAWVTEFVLDTYSPSDLQILIYRDDALWQTLSVPVTANVRKPYRIQPPRNTKGYRLRAVVKTTAADAAGSVGFEPYSFRARFRGTGALTDLFVAGGDTEEPAA